MAHEPGDSTEQLDDTWIEVCRSVAFMNKDPFDTSRRAWLKIGKVDFRSVKPCTFESMFCRMLFEIVHFISLYSSYVWIIYTNDPVNMSKNHITF